MLLETLDVKNNDIVIFSENNIDLENNFKIIFKKGVSRKPIKIGFEEMCEFVRDPAPKNLIVYRLLTNIKNLDPYSSEFGYFIEIEDKLEMFYFDPIYAVEDLKYLTKNLDRSKFRFKIQQVGLTTMPRQNKSFSYSEVFSIDLKAIEAKHQNDKIFADAIFVFDPTYNEEEVPTFGAEEIDDVSFEHLKSIQNDDTNISPEKDIQKIDIANEKNMDGEKFSKDEIRTQSAASSNISAFSNFIKKHKIKIEEERLLNDMRESDSNQSDLDLFNRKNLNKKRIIREDSVILKFTED